MNYLPNDRVDPQDQLLTENFVPAIQEGDIIIFPSYLYHKVTPNTSDLKKFVNPNSEGSFCFKSSRCVDIP